MRFGGHETFALREGWLHKGLKLLAEQPDLYTDPYVADWLGVGRNMAKSIKHWLTATGLVETAFIEGTRRRAGVEISDFGRLVYEHDPYFLEPGTWWMLHVNLVTIEEHAEAWTWFFNNFHRARFERTVVLEGFVRYLTVTHARSRIPSHRTLERDVACLLASYAREIPDQRTDPEDGRESPFIELGLLSHYRTSGYYQLHQGAKPIPTEVLSYSLASAFHDTGHEAPVLEVSVHDAAYQPGGPGRALALTAEALFELAMRHEAEGAEMQIAGLAGDRLFRQPNLPALEWARKHYERISARQSHAA